jgi:DMSO reductase anchor subunit
MVLSAAHLGQKLRSWRAILNVAHSWLSREVLCFTMFVGTGSVYLAAYAGWLAGTNAQGGAAAAASGWTALGWFALALGLFTLISIDRVYDFAIRPVPYLPHSAGALLTGTLFVGLLTATPWLAGGAAGLKLGLYVSRKLVWRPPTPSRGGWGPFTRLAISGLRVGIGLLLPALAWFWAPETSPALILGAVLVAELIDRAEFYDELEILTPARQMVADLAELLD